MTVLRGVFRNRHGEGDFEAFLSGKDAVAVRMLRRLRREVHKLADVEERVHASKVAWARKRVFAAAFVLGKRLEIAVDLLRQVDHALLRQAFPTTKTVITHRITLADEQQIGGFVRPPGFQI